MRGGEVWGSGGAYEDSLWLRGGWRSGAMVSGRGCAQSPRERSRVCEGERKVGRVKSPRLAVGSSLGSRGNSSGRLSPQAMACVS